MQIRIETGGDLRRVTRGLALMADGKELRKRFIKEVGTEVRPLANEIRRAYRASPSQNQPNPPGRGDLRRLMARATTVQVRASGRQAGIRLKVDGRRMPKGMGGVPSMYEGRRPWRHPVFGDRMTWVQQDSRETFDRLVLTKGPAIGRKVRSMADGLARDVAKGTRSL